MTEFERLYERFSGVAMRIAYSNTHNNQDAEDIVQEVFLRLWMALEFKEFASEEHIQYWIVQVTQNCVNDHWRKVLRHPEIPLEHIEDEVDMCVFCDAIEEIDKLTHKDQQVIRLYYFDDQPAEAIARMLNITEGAVRKRLSRARQSLKELMVMKTS